MNEKCLFRAKQQYWSVVVLRKHDVVIVMCSRGLDQVSTTRLTEWKFISGANPSIYVYSSVFTHYHIDHGIRHISHSKYKYNTILNKVVSSHSVIFHFSLLNKHCIAHKEPSWQFIPDKECGAHKHQVVTETYNPERICPNHAIQRSMSYVTSPIKPPRTHHNHYVMFPKHYNTVGNMTQ